MNEAETRAELIDVALQKAGWGQVPESRVRREYPITAGRIQAGGIRAKSLKADYLLIYRGRNLAIIEAKSITKEIGEGVAQAKVYAKKMALNCTYAANGSDIYAINMKTGKEGLVGSFPTPDQLWSEVFKEQNQWHELFNAVPFEDVGGTKGARYYQEIAVNKTMDAIANGKDRILLTLATGTGKTFIAFQIAWKLFQTRWNLMRDGSRRPRILFLADRNILANQAYNAFSAFPEDALVRITPGEIKKKGKVPTNGSIFFTIFQSFMTEVRPEKDTRKQNDAADGMLVAETPASDAVSYNFGEYPPDYFDFIIIDECHRGGANDESNWRAILDYFKPAVQLGLTATPKRKDNVDTYRYFGEPVYIYSLKDGINDGFLTPFKVKRISTTIDKYIYTSDDTVLRGEIDPKKEYTEAEFNRIIEIKEREKKRVEILLSEIRENDKTIVFCASQLHAAAVRDLINQLKKIPNPDYCARVTADDGSIGEQYLREFQDNEKTIPTILTTSQKLSTGVDARNVRNIVLLRPVETMIEFKQIIGRGTRVFEGKDYFTIYDYVDAYQHFLDPEWDGEPVEDDPCTVCGNSPCTCPSEPPKLCPKCGKRPCVCEKEPKEPCEVCGQRPCICNKKEKIKVKLADGKEREIKHMIATSFWSADGKPVSAAEFMNSLFGKLPEFFKDENELREIWSNPVTRKTFLEKLDESGFSKNDLLTLQALIDAEKSDLFDVLEYVAYMKKPITRESRVSAAKNEILAVMDDKQKEFIEFVLSKYIESGDEVLDQEKLPSLLELKYFALSDAIETLGSVDAVKQNFISFQKYLYSNHVA
jgi:type I restriction enzyme R subunit